MDTKKLMDDFEDKKTEYYKALAEEEAQLLKSKDKDVLDSKENESKD